MEEILKSTINNDNKSLYKLELRGTLGGNLYIVIEQNVYSGLYEAREVIKLRPSSLASIIQVLKTFKMISINTLQEKNRDLTLIISKN